MRRGSVCLFGICIHRPFCLFTHFAFSFRIFLVVFRTTYLLAISHHIDIYILCWPCGRRLTPHPRAVFSGSVYTYSVSHNAPYYTPLRRDYLPFAISLLTLMLGAETRTTCIFICGTEIAIIICM